MINHGSQLCSRNSLRPFFYNIYKRFTLNIDFDALYCFDDIDLNLKYINLQILQTQYYKYCRSLEIRYNTRTVYKTNSHE